MNTSRRLQPDNWPDELPGFGQRCGGRPMTRCALCQPEEHVRIAHTFVFYGSTPICHVHARLLASRPVGSRS